MMTVSRITLYALLPTLFFAQAPDTMWTKVYGGNAADQGYDVQQTSDGGYIVIATTSSYGAGGSDIWLIKTDQNGDTLWTKYFGGSENEYGQAVIQTSDGGYLLGGCRPVSSIRYDIWLIKTDENGDSIWTLEYGWDSCYYATTAVCETNSGDYIILGDYNDPWYSGGPVLKVNNMGELLWVRGTAISGQDVQPTYDNSFIIVGVNREIAIMHAAYEKRDSSGHEVWHNYFVDGGILYATQQLPDSNFIITGTLTDYNQDYVGLLKIDMYGDTIWRQLYGDGNSQGVGKSLALTYDGGFVIAGEIGGNSNIWLIRTDSLGDTIGTRTYGWIGSNDRISKICGTNDYGYIAVGTIAQYSGYDDIWLLKFEPDTLLIKENALQLIQNSSNRNTIFTGPLHFSIETDYKIFDIMGRQIHTLDPAPGIYFIQLDDKIIQKVIKIK